MYDKANDCTDKWTLRWQMVTCDYASPDVLLRRQEGFQGLIDGNSGNVTFSDLSFERDEP